jgi:hypothetical protein
VSDPDLEAAWSAVHDALPAGWSAVRPVRHDEERERPWHAVAVDYRTSSRRHDRVEVSSCDRVGTSSGATEATVADREGVRTADEVDSQGAVSLDWENYDAGGERPVREGRQMARAAVWPRWVIGRVGLALTLSLVGCSGAATPAASPFVAPSPSAASSPSEAPNPMASPALAGSFSVDDTGRRMAIACWGSGTPTVIFEGGDATAAQFRSTVLVGLVAAQTRVCLYDHAGHGSSDPAPNRKREAEDLANDLHALLAAAGVDGPFVLAGSSFGGMLVTFYASRFPEDVAGVLTLDTPAPSADLNIENFPEGVWDAPGNDDHLDVLYGFENRFAKDPVHFAAPLTIITATEGQSNVEDQKYWLQTSPQARQIELSGGHDIYLAQPQQVAEQILVLVDGAAASP